MISIILIIVIIIAVIIAIGIGIYFLTKKKSSGPKPNKFPFQASPVGDTNATKMYLNFVPNSTKIQCQGTSSTGDCFIIKLSGSIIMYGLERYCTPAGCYPDLFSIVQYTCSKIGNEDPVKNIYFYPNATGDKYLLKFKPLDYGHNNSQFYIYLVSEKDIETFVYYMDVSNDENVCGTNLPCIGAKTVQGINFPQLFNFYKDAAGTPLTNLDLGIEDDDTTRRPYPTTFYPTTGNPSTSITPSNTPSINPVIAFQMSTADVSEYNDNYNSFGDIPNFWLNFVNNTEGAICHNNVEDGPCLTIQLTYTQYASMFGLKRYCGSNGACYQNIFKLIGYNIPDQTGPSEIQFVSAGEEFPNKILYFYHNMPENKYAFQMIPVATVDTNSQFRVAIVDIADNFRKLYYLKSLIFDAAICGSGSNICIGGCDTADTASRYNFFKNKQSTPLTNADLGIVEYIPFQAKITGQPSQAITWLTNSNEICSNSIYSDKCTLLAMGYSFTIQGLLKVRNPLTGTYYPDVFSFVNCDRAIIPLACTDITSVSGGKTLNFFPSDGTNEKFYFRFIPINEGPDNSEFSIRIADSRYDMINSYYLTSTINDKSVCGSATNCISATASGPGLIFLCYKAVDTPLTSKDLGIWPPVTTIPPTTAP